MTEPNFPEAGIDWEAQCGYLLNHTIAALEKRIASLEAGHQQHSEAMIAKHRRQHEQIEQLQIALASERQRIAELEAKYREAFDVAVDRNTEIGVLKIDITAERQRVAELEQQLADERHHVEFEVLPRKWAAEERAATERQRREYAEAALRKLSNYTNDPVIKAHFSRYASAERQQRESAELR